LRKHSDFRQAQAVADKMNDADFIPGSTLMLSEKSIAKKGCLSKCKEEWS